MAASYEKVIERWLALERGESPGHGGYLSHWRMPTRPGRIDSYGSHFVLAETVRDRKRRIRCFLLNGDRSTMTTMTKHQPAVRGALQKSGVTCIVIPFSALRAAGIDRSSVVPIDVRADRNEEIITTCDPIDLDMVRWEEPRQQMQPVYASGILQESRVPGACFQDGLIPGRPEISINRTLRGFDYTLREFVDYDDPEVRIYHNNLTVEHNDEYGWHTKSYRHWLGDSLFRAKVGNGWRTFLSSFDYQERPALYFLAEIPRRAKPRTVDEAILALSPRIVHAAVAQGREVKRQGDMFAIPTALTVRDLKKRYRRPVVRLQGVFGTDHVVTEQIVGDKGVTYARGTIHHRPGGLADHRRVSLGKEWHLMVPNTVPRRRGAMVRVPR